MKKLHYWVLIFVGLALIFFIPPLIANLDLNFTYLSLIKHPSSVRLSEAAPLRGRPSIAEVQGRAALLNGQTAEAITYLARAIALGRDRDVTRFQLGEAYARTGDMQSAIAQWRIAHAASYFFQRGLTLRHQQDWIGAEAALRLAEQINPTDPNIQGFLAQFYLEWGKPDVAQVQLYAALQTETRAYEQLLLQGEIAQLEQRFTDADRFFSEALHAQPTRPEAYRRLAKTLNAMGQRADAMRVLNRGLQNATPTLGLYLQLAQMFTAQVDFAAADRLYQQAQLIDPQSDEPWLLRAQNALAWNHSDDAENYLRRALELEPNNAETQRWLATVKARRDE